MHKVNEELIGKDSVKKHFLEAQTFAIDKPTTPLPPFSPLIKGVRGLSKGDEGVGEQIEAVREQIAKGQSKQTKNAFDFTPPLEGPGVGNDDEDNLESPDSHNRAKQSFQDEEEIIDDEDVKPSEDTIKRGSATALSSEQVEYPHQPATTAAAQAGRKRGDNRSGIPEPQAGVNSAYLEPQGWMENLELILDIPLQIDVQIGQTKIPLREVLELSSGSIIKLNKSESDSVDLLINGKLVAEGQIVLTDQNTLGIQVTSIVNRVERIRSLR